jgi:hypothetical protein
MRSQTEHIECGLISGNSFNSRVRLTRGHPGSSLCTRDLQGLVAEPLKGHCAHPPARLAGVQIPLAAAFVTKEKQSGVVTHLVNC